MNNKSEKRIIAYSVLGILSVSLIIAMVSVFPLYARLKESRESILHHAAKVRTIAVEEYVKRVQEMARQVTSRSQLRRKLAAYNRGEISREELVAFTGRSLVLAMSASEEVVGITRLGRDGKPLVTVGMSVPEGASLPVPPDNSRDVIIHAPLFIGEEPYLVAGAHIYVDRPNKEGTDIVVFKTGRLKSIVKDYSGLGTTGESILGVAEDKGTRLFFPLKNDTAPVPAILPRGSSISETINKAIGQQSGMETLRDESGNTVIVSYGPIQGVPWGIVVKMDASEFHAPLNRQMFLLGCVIVVLIGGGALGMAFLLRPLTGALVRELQERKKAEERLRIREEQLRTVINNAPIMLWSLDSEGMFTLSEGKALGMLGLKPGEVVGRSVFDVYKETPQILENVRSALAGQVFSALVRIGDMYFETHYEPLRDADGRVIGITGISNDITERQKSREKIEKQLECLSTLRTIDEAITASLDLHHTLDVFTEQVIMRLNVDATRVLLVNPYTKYLEHATGRGFRGDAIKDVRVRLGDGYAGRAALTHEKVIVPELDILNDSVASVPGFGTVLEAEGFKAYFAVPLIAKGMAVGCLEVFHHSPLTPDREWMNFLEALAGQAAIAIDNAMLFNEIQNARDELVIAYDSTIEGWANALDLRDTETEGHSRRVADMTVKIAREMEMTEEELVHARRGALLHDIGKMSIHDSILFKDGPLSLDEQEMMHHHPEYAFKLLYPIKYLRPALDIPYCHHERWDGTGYPRRLKGEQIPLSARIFTIVDTWDALLTSRRYRAAWSREKVLEHIRSLAGTYFDPRIVEVFLKKHSS